MAARLIEGWESSTVLADYTGKWTSFSGGAVGAASGRYGNGLRLTATQQALRTLDAQATWVLGAAVFTEAIGTTTDQLFAVLDAGTVQAALLMNPGGTLSVTRQTGTVLGTSAVALTPGVWYYVEWRVTIGNTGAAVVRVNGAEVLNLPSVDTSQTVNASANQVRLGPAGTGAARRYDDLYVFDGGGAVNADFAGDCRVEQVLPGGAGATTAWTPSAGSNYQCVDDAPPNADTDYVASSTAGQTDTYAFGDLVTASGAVYAVQATAVARKDDAGARSLALVARPGGTDRVGAAQSVGDTYSAYGQVWDANPDTSTAWTLAAVNAAQWGLRLVA